MFKWPKEETVDGTEQVSYRIRSLSLFEHFLLVISYYHLPAITPCLPRWRLAWSFLRH